MKNISEFKKNLIKETLYNSTAQAIIKILVTKNVSLKLFILFYLVLATGLSSYLIIESTLSYLNYQVYTTSTLIHEMPSQFPTITICNRLQFTTEKSFEFLKEINKEISPDISIFDSSNNLRYFEKRILADNIRKAALAKMKEQTYLNFSQNELSHLRDDMLISCTFNGKNCTQDDLIPKFDLRFGNCFVFNSGKNSKGENIELKSSYLGGSDYGLRMVFYVNYHENVTIINSLGAQGARITIDNSSYLRDDSINGFRISPGEETDIQIEREFKKSLPRPYSPCEVDNIAPKHFDSHLYNMVLKSPFTYNQQYFYKAKCLVHYQIFLKTEYQLSIDTNGYNANKI